MSWEISRIKVYITKTIYARNINTTATRTTPKEKQNKTKSIAQQQDTHTHTHASKEHKTGILRLDPCGTGRILPGCRPGF